MLNCLNLIIIAKRKKKILMMISKCKIFKDFFYKNITKCKINCTKCPKYMQHFNLFPVKYYSQQSPAEKITIKKSQNKRDINSFSNRTHTCGELTINNINENVQLYGWLEFQRMGKFIILRDSYGSTQCIIKNHKADLSNKIHSLPLESVVNLTGTVIPRPKEQCNPKMKTGDIEVLIESLEILNISKPQLPFPIRNYNKAKELIQMQYRYLALRFPNLQSNLRIRSWITMKMREYLINQCRFVDVATPTLFRKTPGGAQEFIVPTRHKGKFYSLVQSPQQFKQLLMIGGIDRYFQVAQCYRDEGSRNDRQPEFTQLDIEMSFTNRDNILTLVENLIQNSWPEILGSLQIPFPRITYEEAMETYGSDSPDLRIPGKIYNITEIVKNIDKNFDSSFSVYASVFHEKQQFLTTSFKKKISNLSKQVFPNAKLVQLNINDSELSQLHKLFSVCTRKTIVQNLNLKNNDVLFLTYGLKSDARQLLGRIRVEFANFMELSKETVRLSDYKFLWILDMPLFLRNDNNALETMHHPFTQPHPEDIHLLYKDPLKVRGLQYDLVLNGSEVGGGSIRIHQRKLQEKIFEMLKINSANLYHLLEALDSGAPPHGGIALGLDRYLSILCKTSSIRDVIAFPKTIEGRDLMGGAPAVISEDEKKLYHICF